MTDLLVCSGVFAFECIDTQKFEFYDEALRLFNAVSPDQEIVDNKDGQKDMQFGKGDNLRNFTRDYVNKKSGDFSVVFEAKNDNLRKIGFTPGPWFDRWGINADYSLHLLLRAQSGAEKVSLILLDTNGNKASYLLSDFNCNDQWQEIVVPLSDFKSQSTFDFNSGIAGCEVALKLATGDKVWFDEVYYQNASSGHIVGVTDKLLSQRIAEARETRQARNAFAFRELLSHQSKTYEVTKFHQAEALIELGERLDEANALMVKLMSDPEENENLFGTPLYEGCRSYNLVFDYGSNGRIAKGKLYPETERLLLENLWDAWKIANDIALSRKNTWWLQGSENHDLVFKLGALFTSQIFMNHPDFKDRVYPNLGQGGAYGYGKHSGVLGGRADWSDGKKYTAKDHYEAWVKFFHNYLPDRAQKGLWVEVRSSGYMRLQTSAMNELVTYAADSKIRKYANNILDIMWGDWAQDEVSGLPGGATTRWSSRTGLRDFFNFCMGSAGSLPYPQMRNMIMGAYEPDPLLWALALDRESLGEFEFVSRRPGEEENVWPRPLGNEWSLMCDTESRFLRYSWVTPDYVIGTQMDPPDAVHSHLSPHGRWNGVIFGAANPISSYNYNGVYPQTIDTSDPEKWANMRYVGKYGMGLYRSVQHKDVLITQSARSVFRIDPTWFPEYDTADTKFMFGLGADVGIVFNGVETIVERDGWIFTKKGNAFVAVRPLSGRVSAEFQKVWDAGKRGASLPPRTRELDISIDSYTWNKEKSIAKLNDKHSPVIIETGRRENYGNFENFQEKILSNKITLLGTLVPRYDIVVYKGSSPDAKELVFNGCARDIPTIGGEYVDYTPKNVFQSPYMLSKYNSGVVTIIRGNDKKTIKF